MYNLRLRCFAIFFYSIELIAVATFYSTCHALTLTEALALARQSDPGYLTAQANVSVAQQRSKQAFAGMLPQVNASGNTNWNHRIYTTDTSPSATYNEKFPSSAAQVNLTQALWRTANRIAIIQADAAVVQAQYQYAAADQDLLIRLAQAWFDVLLARDHLIYTQGQVAASKYEWEQNARLAELGIAGAPVREEARMKFDQASAERAAAESDQAVKFAALEQIIGTAVFPSLPTLSDQYTPKDLSAYTFDQWLVIAEAQNPGVLAAMSAVEVANEEIRKQKAGHEPTFDIISSYGKNAQGSGTYGGQSGYNSTSSSIGLQFNLPIYSGGAQNAKVKEAEAMRTKALQELETARRNARTQAKQAWHGWQASQSRLTAAKQAILYTTLNLQAASAGVAKGIKKELDILRARQQLHGAVSDFSRARYELILNHFRLKATVGQLLEDDLVSLDKWMALKSEAHQFSDLSR